jgi:hypothetical protein
LVLIVTAENRTKGNILLRQTETDSTTVQGVGSGDNSPWVIYKILRIYVPNEQLSSAEEEPHCTEFASYGKFTH